MISLYQALKSLALVVSALFSAMNPRRDCGEDVCFGHSLLGAAPEISEHHLAPGALIWPHHNRQPRAPGIRQLHLFSQRLGAQRVLDPKSIVSKLVRQPKHVGDVLPANECQKYIYTGCISGF